MAPVARITLEERRGRVAALAARMERAGVSTVLLGATSNLRYFAGISWHPSERLTAALVHADGRLEYVCPRFELEKVGQLVSLPGEISTWEEDESPWRLVADRVGATGRLAVDELEATFVYFALARQMGADRIVDAGPLTRPIRARKSAAEIALMSRAKAITLEVQRRAREALQPGMRTSEVVRFIDQAHRSLGADGGNTFCLVSFGADSALPHGGEGDPSLREGDVVLIDTGCRVDGYNSDITRTYVFGEPTPEVRRTWDLEKQAQAAAFEAARLGEPCQAPDAAARRVLEAAGLGPDYRLPGLPHRTGHGIGLDVHEPPNLVRGDLTPLAPGMCFSDEPMIVIPGRFGVRLEDHFHMTDDGPRWFTPPAASLDDPFASAPPFVP